MANAEVRMASGATAVRKAARTGVRSSPVISLAMAALKNTARPPQTAKGSRRQSSEWPSKLPARASQATSGG